MKTIEDLVAKLNSQFTGLTYQIPFKLEDDDGGLRCFILFNKEPLVEFNKDFENYCVLPYFSNANYTTQKLIIEYLANTDVDDWFSAKKYNIVIGEGECVGTVAAYCAMDDDVYVVDNRTEPEQLKDGAYQFTEEEIDNFKIKLSNKFAEIVDLGKVEVKDD